MRWLIDIKDYLWIVFGNVWGILLLITGVVDLWERSFDRKTRIPSWLRISVLVGVVFVAQAVAYKQLYDNPPTVLKIAAPPSPIIQVTETSKPIPSSKVPLKPVQSEQTQSGHDNSQNGPITQGSCSSVQQGGSGNQSNINCGPPPLKLDWSAQAAEPSGNLTFSQIVIVKANVEFHPVSFVIVCDQEIKMVSAYGVFFGTKDFGVTQQNNKVGLVYYENPPLAPGVPLKIIVASSKPFKVLDVKQAEITPRKNVLDAQ